MSSAGGAIQRVDVVLSAVYARLLVLPWADALTSESRWQTYAESRFDDLFGEPADGWRLRVIAEPPPKPRLAAALPMGLWRMLEQVLDARLRSIRIDALTRLDSLRHAEPGYSGVAVDIGSRHALVSLMTDGTLQRVRLRRMAPSVEELHAAVQVEWAGLGHSSPLPALALGPGSVFDASDGESLRALAPRVLRLV